MNHYSPEYNLARLYSGGFFMSDKKKLAKAAAVGCICGILGSAALTGIFAAIILGTGLLPNELTDCIMAGILGAGAIIGGIIAAKINGGAGIPVGGITGLAIFFVTAVASLSRSGAGVTSLTVIKLCASAIGGIAGGILGLKEKRMSKYKRF